MSLPKDFSKKLSALTARYQGLDKNKADFASPPDQSVVAPYLAKSAKIKEIDGRQEQAKAILHQISEELGAALKDMEALDAKLVSLIYSKYTKKSDKLEEFGLKAWKTGGVRGPRKAKTA